MHALLTHAKKDRAPTTKQGGRKGLCMTKHHISSNHTISDHILERRI
jgi:hypothetical protein